MTIRTIFFTLIAAGALTLLASGTGNAQRYADPTNDETNRARQSGPCRDPWISMAVNTTMGRTAQGIGDQGECAKELYNGGQWNDYNTLAHAVKLALGNMASGSVYYGFSRSGSKGTLTLKSDGATANIMVLNVVSNHGGHVISDWGAGLISVNHSRLTYTVQTVGNQKRINLGKSILTITKR